MPNYNLIRFIRRNINQLKKDYGGPITLYTLSTVSSNYKTGVKAESHTSYQIRRAVVLPVRLQAEVIQTISMISANKKFVQGGSFGSGTRTFIIDRQDLPAGVEIAKDDWITYLGKRYELKWIDEFEQNTAWVITAKSLEGHAVNEDIPGTANGNRLELSGTAVATV